MSVEYDLKQKLDVIIEYAYKDCDFPKKERFKWFSLKVSTKQLKSKSGHYDLRKHEVVIFDATALEANNISTLLHEVAHHIDYVMHKKTGHQKEFYEIFKDLIYAALDLKYIDLNSLKNMEHRNVDYNKIMKILDNYKENFQKENNLFQLKVGNSYSVKEKLKKRGYFYNGLSRTWDKSNLSKHDAEFEKRLLINQFFLNEEDILIVSMNRFNFHATNKQG